jgi:hypothetical protein
VSSFIARGKYGVVEKELIEIAEAAHQESSRNLLPDGVVVPHQGRGCRFGVHEGNLYCALSLDRFVLWRF